MLQADLGRVQVAIGHKGKGSLSAVCHGQSGHSALAPRFLNALHVAGDFLAELRKIQDTLAMVGAQDSAYDIPYSTVHVGRMRGGEALNIVPVRAEILFEYRHLPADDPKGILSRIQDSAQMVRAAHRLRFETADIEIHPINSYPGLEVSPKAEVTRMVQGLVHSDQTIKVAFGTEAGVFAGLGIPTVVCGPGSMTGQGHKADEFITVAQLAECDRMMDGLLAELTGRVPA